MVEITVPMSELRKNKLFIATPMYGGMCAGMFTKAIADLTALCAVNGIEIMLYFLSNESLITRARNYCCDAFLRSGATHLMFIDADIGFTPQDVIALMAMTADPNSPYDVIGGPYPKKCISWEKIKMAVDQGKAESDPNILEKFVGDYVFNPKVGTGSFQISEPAEVLEIGTGFMMIPRRTLEKFLQAYPESTYRPDHARMADFDGSREIGMYFQADVDPKTKRYLSEDYWFTQRCIDAGLKVWLCPWMSMNHVGTYVFGGSLADLATIGASATVDPAQLKKKKN
jgi:hypothetical protein